MKLTENFPEKAGSVSLKFSETRPTPGRIPGCIVFPKLEGMEVWPLRDGNQVVVHYKERRQWWAAATFFCGEDESPFLTALTEVPYQALAQGGEAAFFNSMKPDAIKALESAHPNSMVRRQGDIWSISTPLDWWHVCQQAFPNYRQFRRRRRRLLNDNQRVMNVFRTNHQIKGKYYSRGDTGFIRVGDQRVQGVVVAEGTLTAPDHAAIVLTGGPHILARTPHLLQMPESGYD